MWFDDDELQAVLRFIAMGNTVDEAVRKTGQLEIMRDKEQLAPEHAAAAGAGGEQGRDGDVAPLVQMGNAVGQLMEGVFRLVGGVFGARR